MHHARGRLAGQLGGLQPPAAFGREGELAAPSPATFDHPPAVGMADVGAIGACCGGRLGGERVHHARGRLAGQMGGLQPPAAFGREGELAAPSPVTFDRPPAVGCLTRRVGTSRRGRASGCPTRVGHADAGAIDALSNSHRVGRVRHNRGRLTDRASLGSRSSFPLSRLR